MAGERRRESGVVLVDIEIAGQDMKSVLMPRDRGQERANFHHATALRPRRMHGAEMDAEDVTRIAGRHNFKKRVTRQERARVRHAVFTSVARTAAINCLPPPSRSVVNTTLEAILR